jgi:hypothetical protein
MQNLRKIYETELQKKGLHSEIEKAKQTFEVKPFVQEFLRLKQLVFVLRPGLSLFSIITGFGFLFYQFCTYINIYVAVILALLLLIGVELIKSEISTLAFKRVYIRANGLTFVLSLFALTFFGLSIFLSVNGAKEIYKHLDTKTITHQATTSNKMDSTRLFYDHQIASERKGLEDFKNSVSWQGKINIADKVVAGTITSYQGRIDNLLAEKVTALGGLNNMASEELSVIEQKSGFEIEFWFWLSLGIEFSILLCIWFLVFFAYHTSNESAIFDNEQGETLNNQMMNFLSLVNPNYTGTLNNTNNQIGRLNLDTHNQQQEVKASTPIGFNTNRDNPHFDQVKPQVKPLQKSEKINNAQYLLKYREVVSDIESGLTFSKMVEKTYQVFEDESKIMNKSLSMSTLKNIKRVYANQSTVKLTL